MPFVRESDETKIGRYTQNKQLIEVEDASETLKINKTRISHLLRRFGFKKSSTNKYSGTYRRV